MTPPQNTPITPVNKLILCVLISFTEQTSITTTSIMPPQEVDTIELSREQVVIFGLVALNARDPSCSIGCSNGSQPVNEGPSIDEVPSPCRCDYPQPPDADLITVMAAEDPDQDTDRQPCNRQGGSSSFWRRLTRLLTDFMMRTGRCWSVRFCPDYSTH